MSEISEMMIELVKKNPGQYTIEGVRKYLANQGYTDSVPVNIALGRLLKGGIANHRFDQSSTGHLSINDPNSEELQRSEPMLVG